MALTTKRSKESVDYRNKPKNGDECEDCRHFIPPSSCEGVAGVISPHGWCERFSRAKD